MTILVLIGCDDVQQGMAVCSALASDQQGEGIFCSHSRPSELAHRAQQLQPQIILLHDDGSQFLLCGELTRIRPRARLLLMYSVAPVVDVTDAIRRGIRGGICASASPALMARAVRAVHAGETWFSRDVLYRALLQQLGIDQPGPDGDEDGRLTPRQEQIMDLIGFGLSNKEIARRLSISDHTVKTHLHRIYVKLNRSGRYKALLAQPLAGHGEPGWAVLLNAAPH